MSVQGIMEWTVDIDKPVKPVQLGPIFEGDQDEFKVSLHLFQDGQPVSLTGATVTAYMRRADRTTVVWSGSVSSNIASVVLTHHVHTIPGRAQLAVRVTIGNTKHTIFAAEGDVRRTTTDAIVDPTGVIPSLDDLLALIGRMEAAVVPAEQALNKVNQMETVVGQHTAAIAAIQAADARQDGRIAAVESEVDHIVTGDLFDPENAANVMKNCYIDQNGAHAITAYNGVKCVVVPIVGGETYTITATGEGVPKRVATFEEYPSLNVTPTVGTYKATTGINPISVTAGVNDKWLVFQPGAAGNIGIMDELLAAVQIVGKSPLTMPDVQKKIGELKGDIAPLKAALLGVEEAVNTMLEVVGVE